MTDGALDPGFRSASLARMPTDQFDVLVIGGGITGVGIALDAASRGLSVALVEARDLAEGTSSRSSKLIHGGLRYLEMRDFGLVREALRERRLLLTRIAPHLVHPVPFLFPLTHRGWERPYMGAGLLLYDSMGGARHLPRHRHLSRRAALAAAPALRPDSLVGAVHFHDAQEDDALYVAYVARTAAAHGAAIATRVRVTGFDTDESGRVTGVQARDEVAGGALQIRCMHVVAAVGAATTACSSSRPDVPTTSCECPRVFTCWYRDRASRCEAGSSCAPRRASSTPSPGDPATGCRGTPIPSGARIPSNRSPAARTSRPAGEGQQRAGRPHHPTRHPRCVCGCSAAGEGSGTATPPGCPESTGCSARGRG